MNPGRKQWKQFWWRYESQIKGLSAVFLVLLFYAGYRKSPRLHSLVDLAVTPAVAGLTVVYSKFSTVLFQNTGINIGFVTVPPDPEFVYSVRLATYINEKRASPLLDLAVDTRVSPEKRERALQALLKFESSEHWIQPFLNELSKGGLIFLYEKEPQPLNDLVRRVRAEGGVRQTLVRAYAEVVLSFMLQHPTLVMRRPALEWVSDLIPEDALFLLIPRFERETEPEGRKLIEQALFQIRAVSEPETAKQRLIPYFKKPPWPGLRLPIAVILTRLGYSGAAGYLTSTTERKGLGDAELMAVRVALARTPLPRRISISESERGTAEARRRARDQQHRLALEKQRRLARETRMKEATLARAARAPAPRAEPDSIEEPLAAASRADSAAPADSPEIHRRPRTAPRAFPIPGAETVEPGPEPVEEVARLPEAGAATYRSPRPHSLMNLVDMVFEVTGKDAAVYQNPGMSGRTNLVLTRGTKGKASFEFLIGDEKWYQVKTKQGEGWVHADQLRLFDLAPQVATVDQTGRITTAPSLDGARAEETYFEASVESAPLYETPSQDAKKVGQLAEGTAYLAVKSEKVGPDRWFLLKVDGATSAWARGIDLRLADIPQPGVTNRSSSENLSLRGKTSAFQAEWIVPGVKGVGVYQRPSLAGALVTTIDPPTVFKVVESVAGDGKEWYKIALPEKKEGWVQVMDVRLTSAPPR